MQTASNEQVKIRVIANSSSTKDQQLKHEIVENIQSFILSNNEKLEDIHFAADLGEIKTILAKK